LSLGHTARVLSLDQKHLLKVWLVLCWSKVNFFNLKLWQVFLALFGVARQRLQVLLLRLEVVLEDLGLNLILSSQLHQVRLNFCGQLRREGLLYGGWVLDLGAPEHILVKIFLVENRQLHGSCYFGVVRRQKGMGYQVLHRNAFRLVRLQALGKEQGALYRYGLLSL
jgi:hypothetical protein